ncbi:MAG: hypothetical protein ABWZ64_04445 [Xanthobacteraceae bacterium]|jgi:hypothetical protein
MLRFLWGAFALACGIVQVCAGSVTPPDDSGAAPMRFEWRREGPVDACGANCRTWISATGYITADTPREFENFAKDPKTRGAVLVLDSDGGSVLGTLALGRAIRSLDMITTVGKTIPLPANSRDGSRAALSSNATCESMCAFLLLAGSQRYVPPQAHVLVHQIWLGKKRKHALESNYSAEELNVVQRDIGRLAQYTVEMGGGVDLLETALRVPPWEPLYRLSADELQRMRLNTIEAAFASKEPRLQSAHATAGSLTTVGQQNDSPRD